MRQQNTPLLGAVGKGLAFITKAGNYFQGRGYWAQTCKTEVATIASLLGDRAPAEPVVFDVGANKGDWAAAARQRWPQAKLFLFEPSSSNHTLLCERFRGEKTQVAKLALSDQKGEFTLFSDVDGSGMASLHQRKLDHINLSHEAIERVSTDTLDNFCAEAGVPTVDILKLDIEGHELQALKGAQSALEKIHAIQFEFGGCNIDSRTYFRDFYYFLSNLGFELYRITPFGPIHVPVYRELDETFVTTNYVAVRQG